MIRYCYQVGDIAEEFATEPQDDRVKVKTRRFVIVFALVVSVLCCAAPITAYALLRVL